MRLVGGIAEEKFVNVTGRVSQSSDTLVRAKPRVSEEMAREERMFFDITAIENWRELSREIQKDCRKYLGFH